MIKIKKLDDGIEIIERSMFGSSTTLYIGYTMSRVRKAYRLFKKSQQIKLKLSTENYF